MGEGALGNTAKEGEGRGAWAVLSPHFPFLARERGCRGEAQEGRRASGHPMFRGSHLPGLRGAVGGGGMGKA